jgi:uncharacterized SAM-binding protein YcdF (DUF218 family)
MTYYVSKVFWLLAAPTSALVLISGSATLWAVLGNSKYGAWLAAAAACGLIIGAFTPIGLALTVPLEFRFAPSDSQVPPDCIILLGGSGLAGVAAMAALSQHYSKARLIFSGFRNNPTSFKIFAQLGGDPARITYVEPRPRTTSEDALYAAALLKPKPSERWMLVTSALHMPRAVGCFRVAGFQVEPYPVEFTTVQSHPFAGFAPGSAALVHFDTTAKEWIGLIAYGSWARPTRCFPARSWGTQRLGISEPTNARLESIDGQQGGREENRTKFRTAFENSGMAEMRVCGYENGTRKKVRLFEAPQSHRA